MEQQRSCRWMVTDHTRETFEVPGEKLVYAVWQLELCPTTGKKHVQGYVVYSQERTFKTMKKLFPGAHVEKARSSDGACYKYCTKEETRHSGPYHIGARPKRREDEKTTDYKKLVAYTEGSVCVTDIIRRIIRYYFEQQRCEPPEVRIKTLASSIMMSNTYHHSESAYAALEAARADRIALSIFERPSDFLPSMYASKAHTSSSQEAPNEDFP